MLPPNLFTYHPVLLYLLQHGDIIGEPDTIRSYVYCLLRALLVCHHMFFSNLLDYGINSRCEAQPFGLMGNWLVIWRCLRSFSSRPKEPRADHEGQPVLIGQFLIIR